MATFSGVGRESGYFLMLPNPNPSVLTPTLKQERLGVRIVKG